MVRLEIRISIVPIAMPIPNLEISCLGIATFKVFAILYKIDIYLIIQ